MPHERTRTVTHERYSSLELALAVSFEIPNFCIFLMRVVRLTLSFFAAPFGRRLTRACRFELNFATAVRLWLGQHTMQSKLQRSPFWPKDSDVLSSLSTPDCRLDLHQWRNSSATIARRSTDMASSVSITSRHYGAAPVQTAEQRRCRVVSMSSVPKSPRPWLQIHISRREW